MTGLALETVYFYGLVIAGSITLLYVLFSDALDAVFGVAPGALLSPTVALSFVAVLSGAGYSFESLTDLSSINAFVLSVIISFLSVTLIHVFILVPMTKAESSISFSMKDLVAQEGEVIVTIPKDGFGEVMFKTKMSIYSYPAISENNEVMDEGTQVRVRTVDVTEGVVTVEVVKEK